MSEHCDNMKETAMACPPRLRVVLPGLLLVLCSGLWAADEKVSIVPRPKAPPAKKEEKELKRRESTFKLDVSMVLVPVSVVTPMGQLVTGLEKEHFRVLEDNKEQTIAHFGSEDAPLSLGIIFDASGSMGAKLAKSRQAVAQF